MLCVSKMSDGKSNFSFDKLNNCNYPVWAFKMQMFLMKENCWHTIENDEELNAATMIADKRAWNFIVLGVDDSQHVHVKKTTGGRQAWQVLKEIHIQSTLSARIRIMKNLFRMCLVEGASMQDHLQRLFEGFDELDAIGAGLESELAVCVILASLNSTYEPLITALEAWDSDRLTLQAVRSKLLEEWRRKTETNENPSGETALASQQNGVRRDFGSSQKKDEKVCFGCGKKGHIRRNCRAEKTETAQFANAALYARLDVRRKNSSNGKNALITRVSDKIKQRKALLCKRLCYDCREYGHGANVCPIKKKIRSEIQVVVQNKREIKIESHSAKLDRLAKYYSFVSAPVCEQDWIVDSGASAHMCGDENSFSELEIGSFGDIVVANGDKIRATGKGKVNLSTGYGKNGLNLNLEEVLLVPGLESNLISVKRIANKGLCVSFKGDNCYLKGDFGTRLIAANSDGLYKLKLTQSYASVANNGEFCVHEYHKRLAHRNLADVRKLSTIGIKFRQCKCSDLCDPCIKGKMSKLPYPNAAKKEKRLDCIVSDVCEMPIDSLGGAKYFVTYTDVYSGFTEVAFIKRKSEVKEKTIQFIERMRTQLNEIPRTFRTDRGTEFLNEILQSYLMDNGIKFECTVGYSPQQNGIAERKNRTLVEAARTMLIASDLSKKLWAEAINNANQTFNCIPVGELNKSPHELLYGKPPKFDFREFGCEVFVMVPYEKRRKLDDKADLMRYLGHDLRSKGFRVLSANGAVKVSREVKFVKSNRNKDSFDVSVKDSMLEYELNDKIDEEQSEEDGSIQDAFVGFRGRL